jgi:asparagine synthase (glutamine-hydrolysing)
VFDQATTSDERPFITVIEEHRGARGHHSNEVDHPLFAPVPWDEVGELPTPNYAGHRRHEDLRRHMGAIGARVLLSGFAGDQIFWGDTPVSPVISDQVRSLRFADAFRSMNAWASHQREPYSRLLWSTMVQPFVPARLRRLTKNERFIGDWLDAAFIRAHGLDARIFGWKGERHLALPSQREAYSSLQDAIGIVSNASSLGRDQFHTAYPFLHRPLVEFALAIPIGQHLRPGQTRSLMRRALRGLLPDPVRLRTSKQGPGEAVYRAVAHEWPRLRALAADARVTRRGYIRAGAFETMLDTARRGLAVNIPALLRTVALEYWLRSLEHSCGAEVQPEISISPVMQLVEGRG